MKASANWKTTRSVTRSSEKLPTRSHGKPKDPFPLSPPYDRVFSHTGARGFATRVRARSSPGPRLTNVNQVHRNHAQAP